jgi:hypothetical protein
VDNQFEKISAQLDAWQQRRQRRDGLIWLPRLLLIGLLLSVLLAAAARFRPFLTNRELTILAISCIAIALLGGLFWLLSRRPTLPEKALFADTQFQLFERTSTAVEIHQQILSVPAALARQQLADTATAVSQVDTKRLLPYQINRQDWLIILFGTILLLLAIFLPNPQESILLERRALADAIAEQAAEITALQEEIAANETLTPEQQEALQEPLTNALEGLQEGAGSREEAVATLSEAEADLRELAAQNDQSALRDQLNSAGQPLAENASSQEFGQSLQNGDLSQAAANAAQLADTLPQLSADEQSALAADLAETAANLAGVDSELSAQLAAAAEALQNGDVAAAQAALREAAGTLQERAQSNAAAQQAEGAADQLNEGRQDVAQAGQTGEGGETAEGGESQNGQQGQNPGEGNNQGPGQGAGQGEGQGQGNGQGQEGGQGDGQGGPGPGGGHTENVFVPDFVDLSEFAGEEIELPAECLANPANCGDLLNETPTEFTDENSVVPYTQVFGDYRDAANEALAEDYIPLSLKGYVREYFSSLEP